MSTCELSFAFILNQGVLHLHLPLPASFPAPPSSAPCHTWPTLYRFSCSSKRNFGSISIYTTTSTTLSLSLPLSLSPSLSLSLSVVTSPGPKITACFLLLLLLNLCQPNFVQHFCYLPQIGLFCRCVCVCVFKWQWCLCVDRQQLIHCPKSQTIRILISNILSFSFSYERETTDSSENWG